MLSALSRLAASATTGEAILRRSVSPKGRRISFDDILGVNLHYRLGWSQGGSPACSRASNDQLPGDKSKRGFSQRALLEG